MPGSRSAVLVLTKQLRPLQSKRRRMMITYLRFQILISCIQITVPQMLQITTINQEEDKTPVSDIKAATCMHVRSRGYLTLRGGLHSGRFTKHLNINDIDACLDECCSDETCNVAYFPGTTCYTIACTSSYLCDSIPAVASSLPAEDVQVAHVIRNKDDTYQDDMLRRTQQKRHVIPKTSTTNATSPIKEISKKPLKKTYVDASRYYMITSRLNNRGNRRNGSASGIDDKGAICEYSCVISRSGLARKIGNTLTMFKCADQCCQEKKCRAAVLRNNKCSAMNNTCEGSTSTAEAIDTMMIRVTKRNGEMIHRGNRAMCSTHCPSNKCDEIPCFCDSLKGTGAKTIGGKGIGSRQTGLFHCRHSNCHPECGDHGTCDVNNRCLCNQGWTGVSCNKRNVCTPPCTNGVCLTSHPRKCKCDFGWSGLTCNISYMEPNDGYQGNGFGQERNFGRDEDDLDVGEGRDGVYFVDSVSLPELNVRLPKQQRRHNDNLWRTIATIVVFVICGVGVTSLVMSAVIVVARKMVMSHKVDGYGKLFDAN